MLGITRIFLKGRRNLKLNSLKGAKGNLDPETLSVFWGKVHVFTPQTWEKKDEEKKLYIF